MSCHWELNINEGEIKKDQKNRKKKREEKLGAKKKGQEVGTQLISTDPGFG